MTAITLIVALLLTSCSGTSTPGISENDAVTNSPSVGGTLRVAINGEPPSLDWSSSSTTLAALVGSHIFEQLFAIDEKYTIKPMLAEDYEVSRDGLRYTIRLRKGVKFHNGKTMTAEDVVASIERWGRVSGTGKIAFEYIKSVRALDDHTIQIDLKKQYSPLLANMAATGSTLIIVPSEVNKQAGDKPLHEDQLIGTGPFKFAAWEPGHSITLRRFNEYTTRNEDWGGLTGRKTAYVDEIQFVIVKDPQVRLAGLQTGEYDYAIELEPDMYEQVKAAHGVTPVVIKSFSLPAIVFNKKAGLFTDIRMRKAVNYAINKRNLALSGLGNETFWDLDPAIFFPDWKELYTTEGQDVYNAYDPEMAQDLLRDAGYRGEPVRIITTKDYAWIYNLSQELSRQLSQVGFKVDVQVYDWATMAQKREDPQAWDIFITGFTPSSDPTTIAWLKPTWPGWYQSDRMRKLIDQWVQTSEPSERRRLVEEIQRTVYEELPVIKVAYQYGFQAHGKRVKGFREFVTARFWNVWLSQ